MLLYCIPVLFPLIPTIVSHLAHLLYSLTFSVLFILCTLNHAHFFTHLLCCAQASTAATPSLSPSATVSGSTTFPARPSACPSPVSQRHRLRSRTDPGTRHSMLLQAGLLALLARRRFAPSCKRNVTVTLRTVPHLALPPFRAFFIFIYLSIKAHHFILLH